MGGVARSKVKDLRLPVDAAVIPGGESSEGKLEDRLWGRSGRAGCFYTQLSVEEKKKRPDQDSNLELPNQSPQS